MDMHYGMSAVTAATISQAALSQIHTLRAERLEIERWARETEIREKSVMAAVRAAMESGATVEPGAYSISEKKLGRFPDWRSAFTKSMEPDAAQAVIDSTPPRVSWIVELAVSSVPPDKIAQPPERTAAVVDAVISTADPVYVHPSTGTVKA